MHQNLPVKVQGHVTVSDDLGTVYVDKGNAVHPQNIARAISRAFSNESNFRVHRIAFGNGGTETDAAFTVSYNTPNDGQPPDVRTWDSRMYNETYSEIVDEGNVSLGTDPGSAGPNSGTRAGGGADPAGDPASIEHVSGPGVRSNELGLTSEIVVTAVLNPDEPSGQQSSDSSSTDTESSFTFDEIGLYTPGAPAIDSAGSQDVDVGNRKSTDDTGLLASTPYKFEIAVDGGGVQVIDFTTPSGGSGSGGEFLYGDLCEAINTGDTNWNFLVNGSPTSGPGTILPGTGTVVAITDNTTNFPSITGAQTFGFLRFTSGSVGAGSTVSLTDPSTNGLFDESGDGDALNPPTGTTILSADNGEDAGVQNDPVNPTTERERLLTHIIFSPVLKAANRTLTITYTLTVSVARTQT